jgi:hypothetical protein
MFKPFMGDQGTLRSTLFDPAVVRASVVGRDERDSTLLDELPSRMYVRS